jgi:hypothetical protein
MLFVHQRQQAMTLHTNCKWYLFIQDKKLKNLNISKDCYLSFEKPYAPLHFFR